MTNTDDDMRCDWLVELVTDYLDGALDAAERARFVDHLRECDGCEAYLGQVLATVSTLGRLRSESLDAALRARILEAVADWPS